MSVCKMQFIGPRLFVAPVVWITVCGVAACQTPMTPQAGRTAPSSPEAAVALMWRTILTTCPVPGEPGKTATFFGDKEYLYEFRDARPQLETAPLTAADRLNKTDFKAFAMLRYAAYRFISRGHDKWPPFDVGTDDPRKIAEHPELWWRSDVRLEVEKRDGQWHFKIDNPIRSPDSFQMDTLSQMSIKKSCAELTSDKPLAGRDESAVARPTSIRNNQGFVKVCRSASIYAGPPTVSASQGSGLLLGTAELGDEGVILQTSSLPASRINFSVGGKKLVGWLANSALCTNQ